jgi:hypothetical protein
MKRFYKPTIIPKFGNVAWQNLMNKTIGHKLLRGQPLTPQEKTYIFVQSRHNRGIEGAYPVFRKKVR